MKGYIGRYITYTGPEFKEGLSLSIHDEISRMRKYAFGCSELVFNPLSQWLCKCACLLLVMCLCSQWQYSYPPDTWCPCSLLERS